MTAPVRLWTGDFVRSELGIELRTDPGRSSIPLETLVGVALRRNPKRAQLLVSTVLAKHVPTVPGIAICAGELLGLLVASELDGADETGDSGSGDTGSLAAHLARIIETDAAGGEVDLDLASLRQAIDERKSRHPGVVTIGYAETATGLGQLVGGTIGSSYIHSTRVVTAGAPAFAGFEEEHSHATEHRLYPALPEWLVPGGTVVLVDDELSTGTTIVNTITAINAVVPQTRWVVASLIDLRSDSDRARFDECATALGTTISVVYLGAGAITLPANVLGAASDLIQSFPVAGSAALEAGNTIHVIEPAVTAVRSARFGIDGVTDPKTAGAIADEVAPELTDGDILVLGCEEFIALPLAVADTLRRRGHAVRFSTTTRSPIAPIDRPDYAIASALAFTSDDDSDGMPARFAYNITRGTHRPNTVILLPEPGTSRESALAAGGAADELSRIVDTVIVVLLPASLPTPDEWTL